MGIITASSVTVCLTTYAAAAMQDPGVVYKNTEIEMTESSTTERFCLLCELPQKPKTEHCPDCDLCIKDYDHHCPWTGKCIGSGNMCAFNVFLGSLFSTLILVVLSTTLCLGVLTQPQR